MTATFYVGDAIEVMSKLPQKSVDLVLTSPPFLALRSYLPTDHPDKALEGGSQATPGLFIDWLIDVVEACDRVLAPHGSLCIELGDTYAGSGGAGGDYAENGLREGQPRFRPAKASPDQRSHRKMGDGEVLVVGGTGWPLAKSLSLIPELFRFTLVYGFNPLTGRQTERWRLRNVVRWVRPNPPVGALGDKFRPATSELMVFCKSAKRYFDLDAVREPSITGDRAMFQGGRRSESVIPNNTPRSRGTKCNACQGTGTKTHDPDGIPNHGVCPKCGGSGYTPEHIERNNPAGAPPLDWWNIPLLEGEEPTKGGPKERPAITPRYGSAKRQAERDSGVGGNGHLAERTYDRVGGAPPLDWWNIPPGGYEGAHYAVFPPELCVKPVKAMCPEKVCRVCGEPSRRIVEPDELYAEIKSQKAAKPGGAGHNDSVGWTGLSPRAAMSDGTPFTGARFATTGWTDCGHDDWRPGLVLDPFGGSGTTALVATGHGRDCILIDLDERNYDLALERVGPFILSRAESV